jgi:hypothetical protein
MPDSVIIRKQSVLLGKFVEPGHEWIADHCFKPFVLEYDHGNMLEVWNRGNIPARVTHDRRGRAGGQQHKKNNTENKSIHKSSSYGFSRIIPLTVTWDF